MSLTDDHWRRIDALLDIAIEEDIGPGDVTSRLVLAEDTACRARFVPRENGILAGMEVVERLYRRLDPAVTISIARREGGRIAAGVAFAEAAGPARSLLTGERLALNILQRMSGVATLTHRYVQAVQGTGARICDTRKTLPGWRALDKLAVYLGGGTNHRRGLYDMVLIKDNHVALAGERNSEASAAWGVRVARAGTDLPVEAEVDTLDQLREVLPEEPDFVLLDNMDPDALREAVGLTTRLCREQKLRRPQLEASGGVTLATVRAIAEAGVDRISVGALTHSAPALDIGLDMD